MYIVIAIVVGALGVFIGGRALALYKNYQIARQIGLPIVISWISFQDIPWAIFGSSLRPLLEPFGFDKNADMGTLGWTWADRNKIHEKLGPAFAHVTPFRLNVVVSDVTASTEILSRWRYWRKDPTMYSMFNVFGPNVSSVDRDHWPRHRKVTSHAFKESNLKLVWDSALKQSSGLLKTWDKQTVKDESKGVSLLSVREDMRKLALHVLAYAIFDKDYEFEHGLDEREGNHKLSYGGALEGVLHAIGPQLFLVAAIFSRVPLWLLSGSLHRLVLSIKEYREYMVEQVEYERRRYVAESPSSITHAHESLTTALIRANENAKLDQDEKEAKLFLTDDDLYGNLFIFNVAGHETTAGTLGMSIPLLALYPAVQAWCHEEIDAVLTDCQELTYAASWHKFVRIRALMYETVRFFLPLGLFPKWTGLEPHVLDVRGKQYNIPADSFVSINLNAVHWDPAIWGNDTDEFKPQRWLKRPGQAGHEEFGGPPEGGEVMMWSFGPRICPGKKFSQVEFVAAMICLLRERIIKPSQRSGESNEQACKRLQAVTFDVEHRLSMLIREPEKAGIICVPRT